MPAKGEQKQDWNAHAWQVIPFWREIGRMHGQCMVEMAKYENGIETQTPPQSLTCARLEVRTYLSIVHIVCRARDSNLLDEVFSL